MTIQEIEKAIQNKNWKIEQISNCGCLISWDIEKGEQYGDGCRDNDNLIPEVDGDDCWVVNTLFINDKEIIYYSELEGFVVEDDVDLNLDEIIEIFNKYNIDLYKGMNLISCDESPEHHEKLKDKLIDFINTYIEDGYKIYISYPRNFANEYILKLTNEVLDEKELTIEEFTDYYLTAYENKNYYMGFRLLEKE